MIVVNIKDYSGMKYLVGTAQYLTLRKQTIGKLKIERGQGEWIVKIYYIQKEEMMSV